jgi:DNA repair protein RAD50
VATTQLNAAFTVNEEQVAKIQDELSSLQKEMDEVVPSIQEANEDYIAAKVERDRVSQEQKARANKYREQHDNFSASLAKLDSAHKAVVELESQLHHADALQYESEMAYLKDKSEHLKLRLRELEQSLAMLKAHDESSRRRALQDAIQCRTLMQQRQEYEAQITQHRTIAEGQTPEQLEAKIEALDKKIDAEKHLRSSNQGKCESLAKDVAKKRAELLAQSKSGDADAEWTKVFVQLETTKLAANDLAISQDVLDKALMKYHSSKMSDINQILKELWESTYQGNDIDYVKIVAENDEAVPSASKVQKNFNYRVVMVKGGVELDMRGRCSAGQKVLASLMIRMALAETFCLNCGILALDEPTSNLDQANVESLAESLRRVIEVRQKQSNFQIIIITHDEEFVKVIGRNSWTDEYYKVKKTPDQYSVIAKKSMRELK